MSSQFVKDDGNESFENGVDRIIGEISSIQKANQRAFAFSFSKFFSETEWRNIHQVKIQGDPEKRVI